MTDRLWNPRGIRGPHPSDTREMVPNDVWLFPETKYHIISNLFVSDLPSVFLWNSDFVITYYWKIRSTSSSLDSRQVITNVESWITSLVVNKYCNDERTKITNTRGHRSVHLWKVLDSLFTQSNRLRDPTLPWTPLPHSTNRPLQGSVTSLPFLDVRDLEGRRPSFT